MPYYDRININKGTDPIDPTFLIMNSNFKILYAMVDMI